MSIKTCCYQLFYEHISGKTCYRTKLAKNAQMSSQFEQKLAWTKTQSVKYSDQIETNKLISNKKAKIPRTIMLAESK